MIDTVWSRVKNAGKIDIDTQEAAAQVSQLCQAEVLCENMLAAAKEQRSSLSANLSGEAASALLEKMDEWIASFSKIEPRIVRAAGMLSNVRVELEDADAHRGAVAYNILEAVKGGKNG